ncbi:helix-turn-helix transcriptional regulator [Bradyrhizobium manausense]|uniref:helix-turn-helix domain-containing protein n=1 Tax=Bradyrhizobium TaxID=374 RepID=UPI001BA5BEB4|nr:MULTISPECIES: helix-turn-helix transcriptional regulator [Bradyrhizobium]MBR0830133.1 helix-turn-helix transcriptional regulator [Bradyrhizobium manausense]UVO30894.1 helix-turn-helix transcriptional regulator [Bradyrhizobium arachidis]
MHTNANFPGNLKLLCNHYRSIAEVCRRLKINRAQFNKYLSGQTAPTAHNLKRICDFFGIDESEIARPHDEFARIIGVRPGPASQAALAAPPLKHMEELRRRSSDALKKYVGYYFEYYHSMSSPGRILRSLVHLHEEGGSVVCERIERLQDPSAPTRHVQCRYLGTAFYLQERIFVLDYESLTSNEITQTVLIPSFKNRIVRLNGLKLGVSAADQRAPCCTRVVWEYLGAQVPRIRCYRQLGLFAPDDDRINADIRQRLQQTRFDQGLFFVP